MRAITSLCLLTSLAFVAKADSVPVNWIGDPHFIGSKFGSVNISIDGDLFTTNSVSTDSGVLAFTVIQQFEVLQAGVFTFASTFSATGYGPSCNPSRCGFPETITYTATADNLSMSGQGSGSALTGLTLTNEGITLPVTFDPGIYNLMQTVNLIGHSVDNNTVNVHFATLVSDPPLTATPEPRSTALVLGGLLVIGTLLRRGAIRSRTN